MDNINTRNDFIDLCFQIANNEGYNIFSLEEKTEDGVPAVYLDDEYSEDLSNIRCATMFNTKEEVEDMLSKFFKNEVEGNDKIKYLYDDELMLNRMNELIKELEEKEDEFNQLFDMYKDSQEAKGNNVYIVAPVFKEGYGILINAKDSQELIEKSYEFFDKQPASNYIESFSVIENDEQQ